MVMNNNIALEIISKDMSEEDEEKLKEEIKKVVEKRTGETIEELEEKKKELLYEAFKNRTECHTLDEQVEDMGKAIDHVIEWVDSLNKNEMAFLFISFAMEKIAGMSPIELLKFLLELSEKENEEDKE